VKKKIVQKVNKKRSGENHFVSELKWRSKSSLFMSKKRRRKLVTTTGPRTPGWPSDFDPASTSWPLSTTTCAWTSGSRSGSSVWRLSSVSTTVLGIPLKYVRQGKQQLTECICFKKLGVNFINILHTNFLYKSALCSFSPVKFWLCNFLVQKTFVQNSHVKCWWNWHQASISSMFYVHKKSKVRREICFCTKNACVKWRWNWRQVCRHFLEVC
jgi:hypothetical protein